MRGSLLQALPRTGLSPPSPRCSWSACATAVTSFHNPTRSPPSPEKQAGRASRHSAATAPPPSAPAGGSLCTAPQPDCSGPRESPSPQAQGTRYTSSGPDAHRLPWPPLICRRSVSTGSLTLWTVVHLAASEGPRAPGPASLCEGASPRVARVLLSPVARSQQLLPRAGPPAAPGTAGRSTAVPPRGGKAQLCPEGPGACPCVTPSGKEVSAAGRQHKISPTERHSFLRAACHRDRCGQACLSPNQVP